MRIDLTLKTQTSVLERGVYFMCTKTATSNVIDFETRTVIAPEKVKRRALRGKGVIAPRRKDTNTDLQTVSEHAAQPVKDLNDIKKICSFFLDRGQYRNYMLFVVGINLGLRYADLKRLRFCHLLNEDLTFKESFDILESKTATTRKKARNRHLAINDAVMDAIELYLTHTDNVHLDDYLFRSESNRGRNEDKPLDRKSVYRIFKNVSDQLGLNFQFTVHSLRKTFAYHQMAMSQHDPRKLVLLQQMFGHSSMDETLRYIGLTREEMEDAYLGLNLGGNDYSTVPVEESIFLTGKNA